MATVTLYYLDGRVVEKKGVRVSKFKKMYHIWPLGPHQPGAKPIMSVPYSQLHAVSRTGRKGINITKF
jgi:hypothetical protein